MAIKSIVCGMLIVALCAAQDDQERAGMTFPSMSGFGSGSYGSMQFPYFPGSGGRPGGLPGFFRMPFNIPNFPSFSGFGGGSSSTSLGSETTAASDSATTVASDKSTTAASEEIITTAAFRRRRAADGSEATESSSAPRQQQQERLPFFGSRSLTPCNYTTEPGATCPSCSQALVCFRNNIGIVNHCTGLFKHCRNGHCSLFPSEDCKVSTTSSAPDTTSNASSSTSSASSSTTTSAESGSSTTTN